MGQQIHYLQQTQIVAEGQTWRPAPITLKDEAGNVITSSAMSTMVLTLYDVRTRAIVNSVDQVNIKNTGRGAINSSGIFTLTLLPADTAIVNDTNPYEVRRALVQYTWAAGVKADAIEITFVVRNLHRRP
jgi:hypothetical protein